MIKNILKWHIPDIAGADISLKVDGVGAFS